MKRVAIYLRVSTSKQDTDKVAASHQNACTAGVES
jgi:DNA invertase Pin-like site-specific DNA recombinase